MIGLVIVTHGHLADELINAMEHVVGPQKNVAPICVAADDNVEERHSDIYKAVETVRTEKGVLVMTDMFGGTPSNLAVSIVNKGRLEIIAGVNLPMLVKFASCRDNSDLQECVEKVQNAGRKYISIVTQLNFQDRNR